jgi:hypothetical protein
MSQKKEHDAMDAALKRLIGDDGFRPQGIFGTASRLGKKTQKYLACFGQNND